MLYSVYFWSLGADKQIFCFYVFGDKVIICLFGQVDVFMFFSQIDD